MRYKNIIGISLSILIGLIIFFHFFNFSVLYPSNTAWISGGDILQNQMGSFAFRSDTWHFPLTKTVLINYPEGISTIYTDSNPLLSIIAKLLKSVFPPEYQFWGIWYLLCWVLQGLFSYLILKNLTKDVIYALLASTFFILLPTLFHRLAHSNLVAHWLILASIFVFLHKGYSYNKKNFCFWIIIFLACTIHAYLFLMVFFIYATWVIKELVYSYINKDRFIKKVISNFIILTSLITWLWALGYFYNSPENTGLMGFGVYSMNINSIINPMKSTFSSFLPISKMGRGQYEGFQYLGAGLLTIFAIFSIAFFIKQRAYLDKKIQIFTSLYILSFILFFSLFSNIALESHLDIPNVIILYCWILHIYLLFKLAHLKIQPHYRHLIIPAIICLLLSLSNEIFIGETRLLKIEISDELGFLFRLFRSSGRFYWVSNLIFMVFIFHYFQQVFKNRKGIKYFLLLFAISLQLIDLQNLKIDFQPTGIEKQSEELNSLFSNINQVKFINVFDMTLAKQALLSGQKVNDFYLAHGRGKLTIERYKQEVQDFKNGTYEDKTLYIFKDIDLLKTEKPVQLIKINADYLGITHEVSEQHERKPCIIRNQNSISLQKLKNDIQTNPITILSVKDEATKNLTEEFITNFDNDYEAKLNKLIYRGSYLAIFTEGNLIDEKVGNETAIESKKSVLNYDLNIKSSGANSGNESIIQIDQMNYSLNKRGINCVTITKDGFFEIYTLDTHQNNYTNQLPVTQ